VKQQESNEVDPQDADTQMNQEEQQANQDISSPAPGFELSEFPSELKKDHLRATDWRFIAIVVFSFILHGLLIRYLVEHKSEYIDDDYISQIQNEYVRHFLSKDIDSRGRIVDGRSLSSLLTGAADSTSKLERERFLDSLAADDARRLAEGSGNDSTKGGAGGRGRSNSGANSEQGQFADAFNPNVQSIGLLGVLSSGSGLVSQEGIQDVLAHADSTAGRIQGKLGDVRSLVVPRPGVDYFGRGFGKDRKIYIQDRDVTARRRAAAKVKNSDVVAKLAETQSHRIEVEPKLQTVASNGGGFLGLRTHKKKTFKRRTAKQIKEIVLAHNPAIQDCYRVALKSNPNLQGKVTVRITVDATGHVSFVEVVKSDLNAKEMENCILKRIRRWNDFGSVPLNKGDITFRHTYVFGY